MTFSRSHAARSRERTRTGQAGREGACVRVLLLAPRDRHTHNGKWAPRRPCWRVHRRGVEATVGSELTGPARQSRRHAVHPLRVVEHPMHYSSYINNKNRISRFIHVVIVLYIKKSGCWCWVLDLVIIIVMCNICSWVIFHCHPPPHVYSSNWIV
jgi:hypothetical protein